MKDKQKVTQGWRPGAVSKYLLRKLNKAKRIKSSVEVSEPWKKSKKRIEEKPTLMVSKINGEYKIEMQVTPPGEGYQDQCTPLVYKIARADNEVRLRKLERKKRKLIRKTVGDAWSERYHPEKCENRCLKAYKQAVGILTPNNPDSLCVNYKDKMEEVKSCSCDDEDMSSDSSMDIDWEIHFSKLVQSV